MMERRVIEKVMHFGNLIYALWTPVCLRGKLDEFVNLEP